MNKNSGKTKTQKIDLYQLLNVEKTSTKDEIVKFLPYHYLLKRKKPTEY
jgi:hypothetical protein